jgi:TrmH family RNA methyltransferase
VRACNDSIDVKELRQAAPGIVKPGPDRGGRIPDFAADSPEFAMSIRIVLVGTTHPGNIGAVARAMKNMGLADLALVNPRYFPDKEATARASGAEDLLDNAVVFDTLAEAITDCVFVAGASARSRAINWPCLDARDCAARLLEKSANGPVAAVFGPEKSGLSNSDLDHCDALLTIPTNPDFSSLNLAMAVQVVTYELRAAQAEKAPGYEADAPLATSREMENFYEHLERVLTDVQFLDPDNPRHLMRRLRRLFIRARPDQNEVNILRGILAAVEREREKDT